ncbi:MAG: alcohol dehydrogenase catalytic domain-containing protein [Chloroflexi bacterium]|nr:alcohol dehydrogenase catalytic domain-containing protein [Chloroflexota bacterium]
MQAVWLDENKIELKEVPRPDNSKEALIRILKAGICSTDLELVKGYYPYRGVLGHEFVGEVVEAPDPIWIGRRVVGDINASCGHCEACRNGRPTHCENRTVLGIANRNGVFAEYTSLPVENLHLVPDSVADDEAVFTEPLAAALEIQQQVQVKPTDRVLLIGAGRLGQLIAQTLALTGCNLHVVARHAHQKGILATRGIRIIAEADIQERKWDLVVEATGSPDGFNLARKAVRPRGTLVLKSTYKGGMNVNFSPLVVDEITLIGSRCGPFEPALRLLEKREVDPGVLIAAEYRLEDSLPAFEKAAEAGVLKILLKPGQ